MSYLTSTTYPSFLTDEKIITAPTLVEPGVKYFFDKTLNNYKTYKTNTYILFSNISMFIFIVRSKL